VRTALPGLGAPRHQPQQSAQAFDLSHGLRQFGTQPGKLDVAQTGDPVPVDACRQTTLPAPARAAYPHRARAVSGWGEERSGCVAQPGSSFARNAAGPD